MKKLKYYNNFINEGLKNFLKPKSQENIEKSLQNSNLSNEQKFINGCKYGFIWLVQDILNKGVDPSIYNNIGILLACENGHIDIVKLLLQDKRVNPTDRVLPLVKFAAFLDYTIEDITTSHNEDEEKDILYTDCIDKSYENGHYDIVKLLLNDERVKNSLNDYKLKLYTKVSKKINESIKDYLKPKSEEKIINDTKNLNPDYILHYGCEIGILSLVKQSIKDGANFNWSNPICIASENGHIEIVKYLLNNGVDIHINQDSPLRYAIVVKKYDMVKFLIDNGADIHIADEYPFLLSWDFGSPDICKLLIDNGADLEKITKTLFKRKTSKQKKEILEFIDKLKNNNVNESIKDYLKPKSEEDILKSINNLTPNQKLLHGLKYDMIELINQSIDEGADVTINDNNLLIWSCENGHTDIVKKILENPNVDVNIQDGYPICIASKNGHYNIVKLLLNHKDIIPNLYHSFCLIWASENGHYYIVKLLLDDGRVDQYSLGYLSKKSAIKNNHYDIVDLLNKYEQE